MPNGSELTDAMEFEDRLDNLSGDDLSRFIARQLYKHCEQSSVRDNRIQALEDRSNKFAGIVGGVSGVLGAIIIAVIDFFLKR